MAESDYTAEYIAATEDDVLDSNVYLEIEGITEKFSIKPVVGLANNVPALLVNPKFSGANIDIDSPKTPLKTFSCTLIDKDNQVSEAFREKDLHEKLVKVFAIPDASLDVSKYGLKAQYRLKELNSRDGNTYGIKCIQTGELLADRLIIGESVLLDDIDDTQTAGIKIADTSEFPSSGVQAAYLDKERISYNGFTVSGELLGVTRAIDSTVADSHDQGDSIEVYETVTGQNFVNLMLQLIISPGGGGVYDVLDFGMGVDESLVDVTEFERVRDETGYLATSVTDIDFRGDEENFIRFLEDEFLLPSATRLWYRDNGQISLLVLAEPAPTAKPLVVQNDMVEGEMPKYTSNSRRIVNILKVRLNFDPTNKRFNREITFTNDNSIAKYGKKKIKTIETRALQTGNAANSFLTSFANKYFSFYATPAPQLDKTDLMPPKQFLDPGNVVALSHSSLPNLPIGQRGIFGDLVQVIGKEFNFNSSVTRYDIFYSTLLNLRIGFIAPTGTVKAGSFTTTVFELVTTDQGKFEVGDVITLWNESWASPPVNFAQSTITAVDGDEITVSPAFSTTPTEDYRLRYADYSDVQESQQRFAFIGKPGGADFDDGLGQYKIGA